MQISAQNPVAYFCAEFGFQSDLPIYAGGLGVLSGDHIKEANDQGYPLVAVGLLYRGIQAGQEIDQDGNQKRVDINFDPLEKGLEHIYVDEVPLFVKVHLTEIDVWCRCWRKSFGNGVTLYLLDTSTDQNLQEQRIITQALYNGTEESLVKQQLILGIGGVKLLHALDIHPAVYHVNEGRPAFLHWQLIRSYMDKGLAYTQAKQKAIEKTVYTNHTLVSAGNQSYNIHLLKSYGQYYAGKMGISIDDLLKDGIANDDEKFSITTFALNTSCRTNGVSALHSKLCEENWPNYNWTNITNAVHMPTWQDPNIRDCNKDGNDLWLVHQQKKQELANFVKERTGFSYDSNRLVISWARRFALYKRVNELFADINRLAKILKNPDKPIQLLIAGKAHEKDTQARMVLQEVIHHMGNELFGHAIFIPDYNIEVAQNMVKGSDVWLNTPIFGQEASGTSGMKAISNGVLQCTVKDGWTHEVNWDGVGFVLEPEDVATSLYDTLQNSIAPEFYDNRDNDNIPQSWLAKMKKSIQLSDRFSATRMFNEYKEKLYSLE